MLRGESTARAVAWDRTVRPGRPVRVVPDPVQLDELTADAATDALGPVRSVLRGGSARATAWAPGPTAERTVDRRAPGSTGRRAGDAPAPRLEEVYAAELARLRQQARAEGWAAGHAEGLATATDVVDRVEAEAAQRLALTQQRWEARTASAVAALTAACAQVDATPPLGGETFDGLVLGATLTLVEEVFARELQVARRPGIDALRRALALSPTDGPVVVRLNPADLERIPESALAQVPDHVRVVGDPAVEPAGAIADAGVSRVDAQLGPALQRVREVLGA